MALTGIDVDAVMKRERAQQQLNTVEVRELGDRIGYGNMMQLAERIWDQKLLDDGLPEGGAHSVGCCTTFLVACPAPQHKEDFEPYGDGSDRHCDWCCGSGRVTQRVALAMAARDPDLKFISILGKPVEYFREVLQVMERHMVRDADHLDERLQP